MTLVAESYMVRRSAMSGHLAGTGSFCHRVPGLSALIRALCARIRRRRWCRDVSTLSKRGRCRSLSGLRAVRLTLKAAHIRLDRRVRSPLSRAIERSDQWVASAGVVSSAAMTAADLLVREAFAAVPDEAHPKVRRCAPSGSSGGADLPTGCSCTPSSIATALLVRPSAQRRIMRQRSDSERATRRRRALVSRYDRSSSLRTKTAIGRPTATCHRKDLQNHNSNGLLI